ncbi:ComEC/Rec2 family competence protein [Aureliella helgolandensis]|uniref:ComEC family competence protein n=1 Tax=Aureliella helgolandensis TaxID=2527968 RepID=A0A518GEV7_9BACT|nr:ComEC/Rec2 family competence protein [Aureliella helgolandensis]QDV27136.1 ComEC family competence protein [Aureliella helgolandensis]
MPGSAKAESEQVPTSGTAAEKDFAEKDFLRIGSCGTAKRWLLDHWHPLAWLPAEHWARGEPWGYHLYRFPMVWAFLAMFAGVAGARWFSEETVEWWGLGCLVMLGLATLLLGNQRLGAASALALCAMVLFGVFHGLSQTPSTYDSLSRVATRQGRPLAAQCVIESAAIWKPNPYYRPEDPASELWRTQWDVRVEKVRDGRYWQTATASCTLSVLGRVQHLFPGDVLEVFAEVRAIQPPTNPGTFDFAEHARQRGVFVGLTSKSVGQISRVGTRQNYPLSRCRAHAVAAVDGWLHRWVTCGQAPLAAALIFGQREQVDRGDVQDLMTTGTLHLLAISGLHVEIVASAIVLMSSLLLLRNRTSLLLIIGICGAYAVLAGGKPPVLRAVILVIAFSLARTLGRNARLANILGGAALVLLFVRTNNVHNIGVQLSFLAVAAIGLFVVQGDRSSTRRSALQAVVEESLSRRSRWFLVATRTLVSMARLSLWVWLITCPLVWSCFHVVSPVAVPLNVVLAVPLSLSLLSGLTTAVLGWIPPLGFLAGGICGYSLASIGWLVERASRLPLGHLWLPAPSPGWVLSFYAILLGWLIVYGRQRKLGLGLLLGGWILIGVVPMCCGSRGYLTSMGGDLRPERVWAEWNESAEDDAEELRCTFIDVGHGTSVMLELPTGEVWLYDAGSLGAAQTSYQDVADVLWQIPTACIDTLMVSHADADHYNAIGGLVERFRVRRIVSTDAFWKSSDRDVANLLETLDRRRLQRETWNAPHSGKVGAVQWQILHPKLGEQAESDNASSLCLLLNYQGIRILLPGDLEGAGLLDLVELPPRPCHVLMAPHHGSVSFNPKALLEWCRPEATIISGNHRALQPTVLEKYVVPGNRLGITYRDGAVQVRVRKRIGGEGVLSLWHWHEGQWEVVDQ